MDSREAGLDQLLFEFFYFAQQLLHKLHLANGVSRPVQRGLIATGEGLAEAANKALVLRINGIAQGHQGGEGIAQPRHSGQRLAKLYLLHQEHRIHRGIGVIQGDTLQLQQVTGAKQGGFEGLIGLIDQGGLLYREQALLIGGIGKAIRVDRPLQVALTLCHI